MPSFEIYDPKTAAVVATLEETPQATVEQLGKAAREAAQGWRDVGVRERVAYLKQAKRAFYEGRNDLVDKAMLEVGKPRAEVLGGDILANLDLFDYFCKVAPKVLSPEKVPINPINYPSKRGYIVHEPLGTVAVVSSWNYPIALPVRAIVPSLLAGNCVLFHPSKEAALTGAVLGEVFEKSLPKGVFSVAQGGREVISAVVRQADRLQFIGSTATARALARQCADQLISAGYELSAVDAAIVLPDCDLERTVHGVVWGAFTNAGQNCASIERVLVHRDVAKAFLQRLVEETRKLRLGDDVGPLRSKRQLEVVKSHVADAVARGAKVLCGGRATGQGFYFEPTVLEVPAHEGLAVTEETFGPTLPVMVVQSVDEAVALSNSVSYGLTGCVWTGDLKEGERIAQRLNVGVAMVNNASFTGALPQAPWGGVKGTGLGITNSKFMLLELSRPKLVLVDKNRSRELWWYPYNRTLEGIMEALIDVGGGHLLRLLDALRGMFRRWK